MSNSVRRIAKLPPGQQAVRARCFHPTGEFVEFKKEEVEQSVPERFEKVVARYPERIAIQTKQLTLTYAKLDEAANRIAHAIVAQHDTRPEAVGLILENGADLIAAMLGVLKAGKFVTPLDPAVPKARLTRILKDFQAQLVITDSQNASLARDLVPSGRYLIQYDLVDEATFSCEISSIPTPDTLAYIFYTSGSTGQPKGVMQSHRNILHNVLLRTNDFHLSAHDRMGLVRSGTSAAIANIFLALLNGAVLIPFDAKKNGALNLASWLRQEKISICSLSIPLFRSFAGTLMAQESFPDLRLLHLASQTVYRADIDLHRKCFSPNCLAVNLLSSSETGPLRDYFIGPETNIPSDVPVGYALDDKELLLLDEEGKSVGFNHVGEIVDAGKMVEAAMLAYQGSFGLT